ncbi:hypothetical protein COX86_03280 [Candidatus Micrarchaeota archaeon CG_4_10_14_0_2_um_filter_60_11]|nr:MAG: hypothetical protein AUJ16_03360 [Candidatus Micrarchaeota archaeon CG1_02_60_51]PIN95796.1 MAG: hypothetical protein COU39_04160 [Candidatus Micrarchaeota archaeon CG10_big_fil_rev_8_21_14_0_10_60_32]PIO01765.1 MAG: hypothetical protein COT58_03320 [Candidatus Micrarchaeota archaeon CG09_land_8_20_14_0_10_60_16]PIY91318.1 MAG: hypothetical protein COY71_03805 [Candidatus Micrarchaeota archaeon CG_4_10_14_0_8_um_filter_60_7]PIZ90754.1 MAG: hypothetical protein COX86_03280 [Candidatus Mi
MLKKFAVVLLFASLLFFGCTGNSPAQVGATPSPVGGAASVQPSQIASVQPSQTAEQAAMGWTALLVSGIPYECTVRMTGEGFTSESKMYFSGGKVRMETSTDASGYSSDTVSIVKGDKVYVSLPASSRVGPYTDCEWLVSSATATPSPGESGGVSSYENVPASDYSCSPWIPDESKFATAGKACDLAAMTPETLLPSGMPGLDASMCEELEGQDLADCLSLVQGG